MRIRHQLAAYSPVSARAVLYASVGIFGGGAAVRTLAERLKEDYGADGAQLFDSGTHALQLAISAAIELYSRPTAVALPAFGCFDLATAALGARVEVAFYDIDPVTLGPDPSSLDRAFLNGAGIAVIAPLYGIPVDWDALQTVASNRGAILIEDAAQGIGSRWRGRSLGSLGRLSVLSFSRGKGWTGGRGGALLRRGAGDAEGQLPAGSELPNVIGLAAQWILGRPALYGIPRAIPALGLGETRFHSSSPALGLQTSAARAILETREYALREVEVRKRTASELRAVLAGVREVGLPLIHNGAEPGYLRLPIRIRGGIDSLGATADVEAMGIAASYPRTLPSLEPFASEAQSEWPGAEELVQSLITLPTHSKLTFRDRDRLVGLIARKAT